MQWMGHDKTFSEDVTCIVIAIDSARHYHILVPDYVLINCLTTCDMVYMLFTVKLLAIAMYDMI